MTTADDVQLRERAPATPAAPFTVERLTGTLGAELSGLDLSRPLSPPVLAAVTAALVEHKVIFFRDQDITAAQHVAFGRQFGPLEIHPFTEHSQTFANTGEFPEVIRLESTAEQPKAADIWHSDVTFRETPSLGSILRARVSPAYGGDTVWADMTAAYAGLDDATRSLLSGLTAVHDWENFRRRYRAHGADEAHIAKLEAQYPPAEHPVVRTHPVSGQKILFVNGSFTIRIKGMGEAESQTLLERLYQLARVPEYQVRFRWRANSIAFWDNRSTQHYAVPDFYPQHRMMERVTVAGDKPF